MVTIRSFRRAIKFRQFYADNYVFMDGLIGGDA
jgi:hypothetical protein